MGCVHISVVSCSFKSCIARVTIRFRESTVCIMVEIISIMSLGSGGREHQLDVVTMVLHDAVVVPSNVASVTNPLLQSREIVSRVEISHCSTSFRFVISVMFGHSLIRAAIPNLQKHPSMLQPSVPILTARQFFSGEYCKW